MPPITWLGGLDDRRLAHRTTYVKLLLDARIHSSVIN